MNALRAAGALTISLVAEVDGKVVGHIAFSPVTISDGSHVIGMVLVLSLYCLNARNKASEKPSFRRVCPCSKTWEPRAVFLWAIPNTMSGSVSETFGI